MEIFKKNIVKKIISFSLCFILTFSLCFKPNQDVYAFDLVVTPSLLYYVIGSLAIASGVVYVNQNEISLAAAYAYDNLKNNVTNIAEIIYVNFGDGDGGGGKPDPDPIPPGGNLIGNIALGSMAHDFFNNIIESLKKYETIPPGEYVSSGAYSTFVPENGISHLYDTDVRFVFSSGNAVGHVCSGPEYGSIRHFWVKDNIMYFKYKWNEIDDHPLHSMATVQGVQNYYDVPFPSDTYKDFTGIPNLEKPLSIPFNFTTDSAVDMNKDSLLNVDWDSIKDKVTNSNSDPDPDPDPDPEPDSELGFLASIWKWIQNFFTTLFEGITDIFTGLFKGISSLIQTIIDWITEFFPWLGQILQSIYDVIANIFNWLGEFFSNIGEAIESVLKKFFNPLPETEPGLNTDGFIDGIAPGFTNPLVDSFEKLKDMDTTQGEPPKIMFNLYQLVHSATERFGDPELPFEDEDKVLFDFATLNDYQFMGIGFMDLTRNIIGFGFIWWTALYILRKFSPDSVIQ